MRRMLLSVLVLLALFTAIVREAIPVQAVTELKPCTIYEIYSYKEANYHTNLAVGNFSAITLFADPKGVTGGQTNWVKLGANEVSFVRAINAHSLKPWAWAAGTTGQIYVGEEDVLPIKWPRIALGSNETGANRNQVCVIEKSPDGRLAHIQGIPQDTDYTRYEAYPWLFNTAYTVYPAAPGIPNRTGYLALYMMPLWEPSSGFVISVGGGTGLWLPMQFLATRLGDFTPYANPTPNVPPVPTLVPPTPSPAPFPGPETVAVKVADRGPGKTLAIRPSPGTDNTVLGLLYPNVTVWVKPTQMPDGSLWGELSKNAFIALYYNGVFYTDYRP